MYWRSNLEQSVTTHERTLAMDQKVWLEQLEGVRQLLVQWQVLENNLRKANPIVQKTVAFTTFSKLRRKLEQCLTGLKDIPLDIFK